MDHGDGITLYDHAENALNGTLTNMDPASDWMASTAFNTWTGSESNDWATATNWSRNVVPEATDNIGLHENENDNYPVVSAAAISCDNLAIGLNTTLEFNYSGTHTIYGSVFVIGTSNIKSGNLLNVTGSFYMLPLSTLNIKPGGYLTIGRNLEAYHGTFTIESDVSSQGSLIVGGSFSGSINVQRHIAGWSDAAHGWHFLSSPVAAQAISAFHTAGSGNDFYKWNEPTNEWINRTASGGGLNGSFETNFAIGTGYLIANSAPDTKTFSGTLNNAIIALSNLSSTSSSGYQGWHFLGNPFPCALDFNSGNWNKTNVGTYAQIWKESTASYKVLAGEHIIPAMNGFMVYVSSGTNSITIPTDARVHSDSNWYKSASADAGRIVLKAVDPEGNTAQESIIRFDPEATEGFDLQFDSYFIAGFAPMFYTVSKDEMFALNTLPGFSKELQIPMGFVKNSSSSFTITLQENIPEVVVYLKDLKTGLSHKLNDGAYSFTSVDGDDPNRFILCFGTVGIDDPVMTSERPKVWYASDRLYVESSEIIDRLEVLDLQGRILHSTAVGDKYASFEMDLPAGICLVKVITEKQTTTGKVFIR